MYGRDIGTLEVILAVPGKPNKSLWSIKGENTTLFSFPLHCQGWETPLKEEGLVLICKPIIILNVDEEWKLNHKLESLSILYTTCIVLSFFCLTFHR